MSKTPPMHDEDLRAVARRYAVAITPAMQTIADEEPADGPVSRQFLPDVRELLVAGDEMDDPIGDGVHEAAPGLIHRYPDRVLLKLVTACAVYCRFCFRREMVGPDQAPPLDGDDLVAALDYIRSHPEIWEVILSGGDPLILSARRIRSFMAALEGVEHVKVVRWHSRVPVVAPERLTDDVVAALAASNKTVWVAVHANHGSEFTIAARQACERLHRAGIGLVGQTVLLAGVNDNAETLEALFRAMVEARVKPYYLHHLDRAPGTGHFRTPIAKGQELVGALRGSLSGLAHPTYVLDIPGGHGKVPIGPAFLKPDPERPERYVISDPAGCSRTYCEVMEPGNRGPSTDKTGL